MTTRREYRRAALEKMQLAKIVGNLTMASAHESLKGNALFLCQPIDENGNDAGAVVAAISPFGGGLGSKVVIVADGSQARKYVGHEHSPLRHCIVCVLDD